MFRSRSEDRSAGAVMVVLRLVRRGRGEAKGMKLPLMLMNGVRTDEVMCRRP